MNKPKGRRRGGVYDDSELYINYSQEQLMIMIRTITRRTDKYRVADRRNDNKCVKIVAGKFPDKDKPKIQFVLKRS